ncbi:MAG TPA: glucose-6-phosphate dehydrogenase assembly protein OpcA [Pyrinomonadaceae bacterium]|jgi:glucose-6-phosphate dehydrogenase assembly protein OpcA|nr:glucose-6-phosphate dehydrogenase assembly protein OpcA [Pyrinomonadaceae bacterium]
MHLQLEKTLDVEVVERQLAELWQATVRDPKADPETAVLRARVANLLVFVSDDAALEDVHQMLAELTAIHPSRVLAMLGLVAAADRDIEMSLESICQTDKRTGAQRLSCEEITLKACGKFVSELPSAALPLLAPDLSTFLWWRNAPQLADKLLDKLLRATDRLVIDSAEFADPIRDLSETNELFSAKDYDHVGISDLNWARLTFWRGLLADFYDVAAYRPWLERIDAVQIDYVGPEGDENAMAPQALLIAGWLASRLGWTLAEKPPVQNSEATITFNFGGADRGSSPTVMAGWDSGHIQLTLNRVERGERKPGRLVQVELRSSLEGSASFIVARSADNHFVLAEARLGSQTHRGRVLPVRNRNAAQLLSREMEILCNDQIYQEAVAVAAGMTEHSTSP